MYSFKSRLHLLPAIFLVSGQFTFMPLSQAAQAPEQIAKNSKCLGCHAIDKKMVGPSFKQISEKYQPSPAVIARLTDKIKNGGVGSWGVVSMPSNKANISDEEIKVVLDWILKGAPSSPK